MNLVEIKQLAKIATDQSISPLRAILFSLVIQIRDALHNMAGMNMTIYYCVSKRFQTDDFIHGERQMANGKRQTAT